VNELTGNIHTDAAGIKTAGVGEANLWDRDVRKCGESGWRCGIELEIKLGTEKGVVAL
jgi:hypothetical protein